MYIADHVYSVLRFALLALYEWILTNTVKVDLVVSLIGIQAMLAFRHPVQLSSITLFIINIINVSIFRGFLKQELFRMVYMAGSHTTGCADLCRSL